MVLKWTFVNETGEETSCSLFIQVSAKTEIFHLVEIYSGDCLEMVGYLADTGEEFAHTLCWSPKTVAIESVEAYLGDGLVMPFLSDSGEKTAHSLFTCLGMQSALSW